jgi:hypothetical protein
MSVPHHPSRGPRLTTRTGGYRLPDVLVAERAPAGIVLALVGAIVCSLGILRACQLEDELHRTDSAAPALPQ